MISERERIENILARGNISATGKQILEELEEAGFEVRRKGPHLLPVDWIQVKMNDLD